jgi:fructose-1,6-bisphosphatase/inositol monophosphatase family enzyme
MLPDIDRISDLIRNAAAEEIMPNFGTLAHDEIAEKAPGDLVTAVDLAMEARLSKQLRDELVGSVVVGEEAVAADPNVLDVLVGDAPVWVVRHGQFRRWIAAVRGDRRAGGRGRDPDRLDP